MNREKFQESFVAPTESVDLQQRIRKMEQERQILSDGVSRMPLNMTDHRVSEVRQHALADSILQFQQHTTLLAKVFFHPKNIDIIQNSIRRAVFDRSNQRYMIDRQNDMELVIVMRSVYFQFARHDQDRITEQVEELNELVVKDILPNLLKSIEGHIAFAGSLHQLPAPMQLPQSTTIRGDKVYGNRAGGTQDMSRHMTTGTVGGHFF